MQKRLAVRGLVFFHFKKNKKEINIFSLSPFYTSVQEVNCVLFIIIINQKLKLVNI